MGSAVATVRVEPSREMGHAAYCRRYLGERFFSTGRREGQLLGGEEREPALGGERPEDIVLGGGAQLDQGIADPLTGIARARLGERQHLGGDDSGLEQRLSEILRRDRGRPVYRHNRLIMRAASEGVKNRETERRPAGAAGARALL